MSEVKGQNQQPAQDGSFLHKSSVGGQKINFILPSSVASASFTLSAGGYQALVSNLSIWPENIADSARTDENLIQPNNVMAWAYTDIYVDNDADGTYYWPDGGSLSTGQQKIIVSWNNKYSPNVYSGSKLYSSTNSWLFYNGDSSSHTIYIYIRWRYLLMEG